MKLHALFGLVIFAGCNGGGSTSTGTPDAGATAQVTCRPCLTGADCGDNAACVQYGASDYCGRRCARAADCAAGESCIPETADDGNQVSVCVPQSGGCGAGGCGNCPPGTTCSLVTGQCEAVDTTPDAGATHGSCGSYDPPTMSSCCHSCTVGSGDCQQNGCYGGWWCDHSACRCHAPPASCGPSAADAGPARPDAAPGTIPDSGLVGGSVGPNGGSVPLLYFAVVGDTRPSVDDDTGSYPSAIITKIYQDIEAMSPRPQFIVTTGDYMFARATGSQGAAQMNLYLRARNQYGGTVFSVMGNHECTGYTAGNCVGSSAAGSNNYQAFMSSLVTPLGKDKPYYTIPISGSNGQWTAKIIVTACNAWDAAQKSWLDGELATATTYTFITRHEPDGAGAPCNADMDPIVNTATYNLLIVGHTHTFSHYQKRLTEGVGGAPITGSANYGYATVEQLTTGGFKVTQYDYQTAAPVTTFTVP